MAILEWITGKEHIADMEKIYFDWFSLPYTCLIFSALLYPVVSRWDLSLFIKMSSFGIFFVSLVIAFILIYGFIAFTNTTFHISNKQNDPLDPQNWNISLASMKFPSLAGMMCLGFYLHNCVLPIIRNSKNPEKNSRDVFIGYSMVFISYICVGVLGYIGFSGSKFKEYIEENSLLMFPATNVLAFIVRLCSFFQMFTVFPILFHILWE